jgi:Flp pilus assembly protein TadD
MRFRRLVMGLALGGLAVAVPLVQAATPEEQLLLDKARYWEDRGRLDMAADSWQKVLLVNPDQPEALTGLGIKAAMSGDTEQAQKYLAQLRAVAPKHPGNVRIREALSYGKLDQVLLAKARSAAAAGDYAAAVAYYKQLLGDMQPEGDLALEYYTTLAGIKDQWQVARDGLQALVASLPREGRYRLALAKHLSYRESSRRQAIGMLKALAADPHYGAQAKAAWRQALLWLKTKPSDAALFEQYLASARGDKAVRKRLAEVRNPDLKLSPRARRAKAGYKALDAGDLAAAEQAFSDVLARNQHYADALAGMGIVRLRQRRFAEAVDYLERAKGYASARQRRRFAKSLNSARVWQLVAQAKTSTADGDLAAAEHQLRQAIAIAPHQAEPRIALGDVLAQAGQLRAAESQYRQVLTAAPANTQAKLGLIRVLQKAGRYTEAKALADQLTAEHPDQSFDLSGLHADMLREQAEAVLARGDQAQAKRLLEQALLEKPSDPWVRLRLAQLLHAQGDDRQADSLLDGLLQSHPDMPEALYVKALMSQAQGRWLAGVRSLERIPAAKRTRDMRVLLGKLTLQAELERAQAAANQGDRARAHAILQQAEDRAYAEPALLPAVATAWDEIGETGHGIVLMRKHMSGPEALQPGFRLTYAALLLKAGQDTELGLLLDQLARDDSLNADERKQLAQLRRGVAIRQADQARQAGELAAAYEYLRPFLYETPVDAEVLTALGRIYEQDGRDQQAFDLYQEALQSDPSSLSAMQALINAAIATAHYDRASELVAQAQQQHPDTAELYILEGRLARAQGDDGKALAAFRHAQRLRGEVAAEDMAGAAAGQDRYAAAAAGQRRFAVNPFAKPRATRPQPAAVQRGYANQARYGAGPAQAAGRVSAQPYGTPPSYAAGVTAPARPQRMPAPTNTRPAYAGAAAGTATPPMAQTEAPAARAPTLAGEIASIEREHSTHMAAGTHLRVRDGESGLSQLTDVQTPLEIGFSPGYRGRLTGRIVPVFLDAGDLNMANVGLAGRFGSNALGALPQSRSVSESQAGVALSLGYQWKGLTADIGTTPLGFVQSNLVGGIGWRPFTGNTQLGLSLTRRAVTDSLLSYAGTRDPRTKAKWGGVVRTGGTVDLGIERFGNGVYASAGYFLLDGKDVASNSQYKLGGGAYWRLMDRPDQRLTFGLDLTAEGYDKNLSHFTLGHGGYFSPSWYLGLMLPLEWTGRNGALAYRLAGGLGVQSFHEQASPYYPNSPALQSQLEALAATTPGTSTRFTGNSVTGLMYDLDAQLEYRLASRFFLGGQLGLNNASDYNEFGVGLYLRYWFEPQGKRIGFPPKPLKPFDDGNPF